MTDLVRRIVLAGCAALLLAPPVLAAEPSAVPARTALDTYMSGLTTWSADFRQTVTGTDGKSVPASEGSGRLVIVRPGKFRLEMRSDDARTVEELYVADGANFWAYDVELAQVTVEPVQDSLSQSPAMLLAGGADLRKAFDVAGAGRRDSLDWVRAVPKDAASDFREAQFGFNGRDLVRMTIIDKLGQRSTLAFRGVRRNAVVDPKLMTFTPPPGVDVLGKPVPVR